MIRILRIQSRKSRRQPNPVDTEPGAEAVSGTEPDPESDEEDEERLEPLDLKRDINRAEKRHK